MLVAFNSFGKNFFGMQKLLQQENADDAGGQKEHGQQVEGEHVLLSCMVALGEQTCAAQALHQGTVEQGGDGGVETTKMSLA